MKMKQVSIACALAFAGISGQALALAPSVAPQVTVFLSGSSAQQKSLGYIAESICAAGTLDVMYNNASVTAGVLSGGSNHRAYFCTATGTGTSIDTKKVLLNDRAQGGSAMGVLPVARSQSIAKMTVDGTCTQVMNGAVQAQVDRYGALVTSGGSPLWSCNNTTNVIPDAGVSDVEPSMFVGINKANAADPDYNATDAGNLTVSSELAVVFGTPVTNDLGITNLSRSQIASILSGNYQDWSQVDATQPAAPITICRRANGSGSQAANNAWFMHFPCGSSLVPAKASDSVVGGFQVIENSSAGAVLSCLNTHSKAIGVLGTETQPGASDLWKFVSIDNQTPNVQNAATGKYDFYVEQTIQWRNKTVVGTGGAGLAPSVDQLALLNTVVNRSGNPTFLSTIPGVAALWTNGNTPSIPFNAANPVMQGTRYTNTCTPTTLQY